MTNLRTAYRCGCEPNGDSPPIRCPNHNQALALVRDGESLQPLPVREPKPTPTRFVDVDPLDRPFRNSPLSKREIEVARLVYVGASDAEIGRRLDISVNTVRAHISAISKKLPSVLGSRGGGTPRVRIFDWFASEDNTDARDRSRTLVYFIQAIGGGNNIKIGISIEPYERLESLRAHSPLPLRLRGYIEGSTTTEAELHARFYKARLHNEWFAPCKDLLSYIEHLFGSDEQLATG